MKKLFLSSSFADVAEFLGPFVGEELTGRTVTFIPTASIPEEYTGYVDNDRKALEDLGLLIEELEISNASAEMIKEVIRKNDIIYVSGGNTFYLLQELKRSGADQVIISEIEKGKLYIGASAGSVIMSEDIAYIDKMDDRSKAETLSDLKALGVVDFYTLPHYTDQPFKEAADAIYNDHKDKIELIPISNTQVIQVNGGQVEVLGNNKKD